MPRHKKIKPQSEGLGDTVAYVLNETPVKAVTKVVKKVLFKDGKDCGCDQRRKKLNDILPYRMKPVRCFTEQEYRDYKIFKDHVTLKLLPNFQVKFVCKLYSEIFNRPYYEPCPNCSPKPILAMIDKLDKVFDSYEKNN
jgi:hypothetical protein